MSTPTEILTAICPGLAADTTLGIFLQMAIDQTSSDYFGINYSKAVALRAAHEWTLAQRIIGEGGAVTSKTEGKLSMSFSNGNSIPPNAMSGDLDQTHYGRQLKGLIGSQSPAISVIGSDDELVDETT